MDAYIAETTKFSLSTLFLGFGLQRLATLNKEKETPPKAIFMVNDVVFSGKLVVKLYRQEHCDQHDNHTKNKKKSTRHYS